MGLFKTALLQSRVPDYPNDDWTTVADVPTGARVLDGGVLKQAQLRPGDTWASTILPASNGWYSLCETTQGVWAGRLVAVGIGGTGERVMTSDDGGENWTLRTSAADNSWRDVAEAANGRLVAVAVSGTGNRVMTSDDGGVTWITRVSAGDRGWRKIIKTTQGAWAGRLVVVSSDSALNVMISDDDGITWRYSASTVSIGCFSLCETTHGAWVGRLVAVAGTGTGQRVMTSDDGGENWTLRSTPADNDWRDVIEAKRGQWAGRLIAVAEAGVSDRIMTSDDGGVTWTLRTPSAVLANHAIAECLYGRLIIVAISGTIAMTSDDGGITWVSRVDNNEAWRDVLNTTQGAWAGRVVAVSNSSSLAQYSDPEKGLYAI